MSPTTIFSFPDEILYFSIFESLQLGDWIRLNQVCRRFSYLSLPLIFKVLDITTFSNEKLHHLASSERLSCYCRYASIFICNFRMEDDGDDEDVFVGGSDCESVISWTAPEVQDRCSCTSTILRQLTKIRRLEIIDMWGLDFSKGVQHAGWMGLRNIISAASGTASENQVGLKEFEIHCSPRPVSVPELLESAFQSFFQTHQHTLSSSILEHPPISVVRTLEFCCNLRKLTLGDMNLNTMVELRLPPRLSELNLRSFRRLRLSDLSRVLTTTCCQDLTRLSISHCCWIEENDTGADDIPSVHLPSVKTFHYRFNTFPCNTREDGSRFIKSLFDVLSFSSKLEIFEFHPAETDGMISTLEMTQELANPNLWPGLRVVDVSLPKRRLMDERSLSPILRKRDDNETDVLPEESFDEEGNRSQNDSCNDACLSDLKLVSRAFVLKDTRQVSIIEALLKRAKATTEIVTAKTTSMRLMDARMVFDPNGTFRLEDEVF